MKETITILDKIELNSAIISIRSDGIIQYALKTNITITERDSKEMVDAAGKVGKLEQFPILIVAGKDTLADKETREYAASKEGTKYALAVAFVITSLAQKLLGNAYLKINKPVVPTALFDNEEKAVDWLKKFIK